MKERLVFKMIELKDLEKLKKELNESLNPLFLFDNDPDGFCSATILLKNLGRGNAIPLRYFPSLDNMLLEKITSFAPDKIFILDKPYTTIELFDAMSEKNIPVFIIDHHEIKLTKELTDKATFFTSFPSSEPTSFICQKLFNNKGTEWISMIGCLYDVFIPDFIKEFKSRYPELISSSKDATKIRYTTEIGKLTRILSLALKSSEATITNLINLFLESDGPNDILLENEKNKFLHRRFNLLNKIIEKNLKKAEINRKTVFLEYAGEYSLSSDISNILFFEHPEKFIVVCYKKYDFINISLRGENAKNITEQIVKEIEGASGGGHEVACGLRIPYEGFKKFKNIIFDRFTIEKA